MSKRQPNLLIEDIIDSGQKILTYTADLSFDEFVADSKTTDAVVRNFERDSIGLVKKPLIYQSVKRHKSKRAANCIQLAARCSKLVAPTIGSAVSISFLHRPNLS